MTPVPKPLPEWWLPLCRYRFGLLQERPKAPKPPPKWCFEQWDKFERWHAWKDSGGKPPRPDGLWQRTPRWAWQLRRELLQARGKPPPEPDPAPDKARGKPSVLLEPGIFMYSAGNVAGGDAGEFCRKAAEAGFRWVAMLAHEGQKLPEPHINPPDWLPAIREHGMVDVAWGGLFTEPELEAQVAAEAVEPFTLYIPNPELPYKLETSEEAFYRADRFVAEFRQHSDKTGAISTLVGADIHYRPFFDAGFDVVMPQCYVNEPQYAGLTPKYGIQRAVGSVQHDFPGWHPLSVAPTIASYGDYRMSISAWRPLLEEAGCPRRWNFYTGEFLTDDDFAAVKALVT